MNISLKTRNTPKLLAVWVLNAVTFFGIATGILDFRNVESVRAFVLEVSNNLGGNWPYIALLTLVSVFNGAFSRTVKERLVFWPAPRPGSRAFSHLMFRDSTIDKKALRERFRQLPTDPDEQNALWAGWLNEFEDDPRVRPTYSLYLFTRDWTIVAATTLVLGGLLSLYFAENAGASVAYGAILLCQFVIARRVARIQGEQLVMTVLACKGSVVARSIGDKPTEKDA